MARPAAGGPPSVRVRAPSARGARLSARASVLGGNPRCCAVARHSAQHTRHSGHPRIGMCTKMRMPALDSALLLQLRQLLHSATIFIDLEINKKEPRCDYIHGPHGDAITRCGSRCSMLDFFFAHAAINTTAPPKLVYALYTFTLETKSERRRRRASLHETGAVAICGRRL